MSVGKKITSVRPGLVIAALGLVLFCCSSAAIARVHFGLSIGTTVGRCYPYSYHGYHPYPSCYGGHYSRLDRGWYRPFPRRHYWPGHSCSPGVGIWIHDYYPVVIDTPVVVRQYSIGSARGKTVAVREAVMDAQQREALRKKKSEQLKILNIGDKEKRIQAIHELAPLAYDNGIRRTLENVLLSDPDPEVRKEVAVSFGKTENQLVLAALTQAKEKDPVREVRQAAYRAIIMIKGY